MLYLCDNIYHIKYFINLNGKKHDAYINRKAGKIIRIERHWNQEVRSGLMNKLKKDIGF